MQTALLGFGRHIVPVPWGLVQRAVRRSTERSAAALGGLDEDQRRVHHFVVRQLPRLGEPMSPEHISETLHIPLEQTTEILDELEHRLIFLYRAGGRDVVWAYPVTVASTPHHLAFSTGERLDAA